MQEWKKQLYASRYPQVMLLLGELKAIGDASFTPPAVYSSHPTPTTTQRFDKNYMNQELASIKRRIEAILPELYI